MGRGRRPAPAHPIRLMAERRVRLSDGVTVTCRTEGTGLPFVWSHGMLASTALEDALGILDWRALAAERLLVRYDARGHGASSGTGRPADHEWPRLAGDLLQILNDLSLDRVTIGGDSMGVGIGLHLAAAAPERVDALVLAIPPSAWGERVAVARVYGALGALVALDWRALAAERLLVRYDARGHGASSGTGRPADHEWPRLAGDLLQILNDLSLDRVTIGGDSMGVGIGLHLAAAAPERVDALVLAIPPSAWGERVAVARVYGALGALVASPAGLALKALHLMPVVPVGGSARRTAAAVGAIARMRRSDLVAVLQGASRSDLPEPTAIQNIDLPALVLAWRGDRVHPAVTAERLADLLPKSELRIEPRPGQTRDWTGRVLGFLRRTGASGQA